MLGRMVCFVLVAAAVAKPRQPKSTYVKVPVVPEPTTCGLANLLRPQPDLFADATFEGAFVSAAEAAVREAAGAAWKRLDSNQDGNLDVDELSAAVRASWKSKRFQPPAHTWVFLWALADTFRAKDLSRSARVSIAEMDQVVDKLLRSVKFLDERRALFDDIAGPGVGDEEGAFSKATWEAWRAS
ncbi:unnamed protein product [Symbiodinium pilosum]|uniref:EF-hand domain-containing protein n=1 Tax=Symbiodinium pilosum TaxID=2952 RepID=A0A812WXT7_SYMPI|nr:unnamed protein product [Symbiodinium pilosum]